MATNGKRHGNGRFTRPLCNVKAHKPGDLCGECGYGMGDDTDEDPPAYSLPGNGTDHDECWGAA